MTIENPIKLKADLWEAALVLKSMRHPILAQAVLQAINLIDVMSGEAQAVEPPRAIRTVSVSSGPWPEMSGDWYDRLQTERMLGNLLQYLNRVEP